MEAGLRPAWTGRFGFTQGGLCPVTTRYGPTLDIFDPFKTSRSFTRTQHQLSAHLRANSPRKIRVGGIIDGNRNHSAKRASQKDRDPLGAVRTPQQYRIALDDLPRLKLAGELIRHPRDALVAPTLTPIPARKHVSAVRAPTLEIVQRIQ